MTHPLVGDAEYLLPDARLRQVKQQVRTNASTLRHILGRAGGLLPGGDVDGVRTLPRVLTGALAELDAQPDESTEDRVEELRVSLARQ